VVVGDPLELSVALSDGVETLGLTDGRFNGNGVVPEVGAGGGPEEEEFWEAKGARRDREGRVRAVEGTEAEPGEAEVVDILVGAD
jgi:hypothetical protein